MALWGWNTIRVGCAYPGGSDSSVFNGQRWSWPDSNDLDAIVNAYTAQGVVVIIANVQRVTGTFLDTAQRNAEVTWWTDIANRYKDYPNVWFDITIATGQQLGSLTQPVVLDTWYTQTVDLIQAIRATGARNIIVARGTNDGQDNLETTAGAVVLDAHSAILSKGQAVTGIDHDVVFGLVTHHYWGVGNATQNNAKLTDYITRVHNKGLALLVISTGGVSNVDGLGAGNTMDDQNARATRATYAVAPSNGVGLIAWHAQPGDGWALTNATKTWPDGDRTGDFANTNAGLTWHGQLMYELLNSQPAPSCPVVTAVTASYDTNTREGTATVTVTDGGSGVTYTYDWGDGVVTTSAATSSVHTYSAGQTGVRTITVTARKTGCANSVGTDTIDLGGTGSGGVEVAFRAASSANNGAGSTTLTLTKPSGVVVDDTMIAAVSVPATTTGGGGGGGSPTLIEAESISVGAKTDLPNEAYWSGYQGTGYKANWGDWDPANDGEFIEFDYSAATAGAHTFEVRYSAGNGNAPRALIVNGTTIDAAWNFAATADWDTWATVSRSITLNSGANTIRLQLPTSNVQYANLDWVRITPPAGGGTENVTVTAPAGWTQITDSTSTSTGVRLYTYRKAVGSGDPASWNWTLSHSVRAAGGIAAYANVDGISPIDGSGTNATVGPSTSHTTPNVTPSGIGRVEVSIGALNAVSTFTATGNERFDQASSSGTGNSSLALYDQIGGSPPPPPPSCPVISSFTNSVVHATKTVTVTVSASNLSGASITFDWGDGQTTTGTNTTASHVYATTGTKNIGVTIVKAGCSDATSSTSATINASSPPPTGGNFQVSGTQILAPDGSVFVPYGGNILGEHAFWPQGSTLGLVSTVKNTWGFNIVGVCNAAPGGIPDPGDGWGRWDWTEVTLDQVISTYTAQGIVCVVRLISNNSGDWLRDLGTGTDSIGTLSLDQAGDWFANYGNIYKNNPYVWWNTLSEPGTGQLDKWEYQHNYIIDRLRGVGANQPIVATATWWGQDNAQYDTSFVSESTSSILNKGQAILAHDPVHNVIMDLHCYNTYGFGGNQAQATAKVADYFDRVHAKGLAIMCLEFGGYGNDGDPALMQASLGAIAAAPPRGIGLVWWHLQPGDGFSLTHSGELSDIGNLTTCGQAFWNINH